jgi:hypothetical protein
MSKKYTYMSISIKVGMELKAKYEGRSWFLCWPGKEPNQFMKIEE